MCNLRSSFITFSRSRPYLPVSKIALLRNGQEQHLLACRFGEALGNSSAPFATCLCSSVTWGHSIRKSTMLVFSGVVVKSCQSFCWRPECADPRSLGYISKIYFWWHLSWVSNQQLLFSLAQVFFLLRNKFQTRRTGKKALTIRVAVLKTEPLFVAGSTAPCIPLAPIVKKDNMPVLHMPVLQGRPECTTT